MQESLHVSKMPERSILLELGFSASFAKANPRHRRKQLAVAAQELLCSISSVSPNCTYLRGNKAQFCVHSWAILRTEVTTVIHIQLSLLFKYLFLYYYPQKQDYIGSGLQVSSTRCFASIPRYLKSVTNSAQLVIRTTPTWLNCLNIWVEGCKYLYMQDMLKYTNAFQIHVQIQMSQTVSGLKFSHKCIKFQNFCIWEIQMGTYFFSYGAENPGVCRSSK